MRIDAPDDHNDFDAMEPDRLSQLFTRAVAQHKSYSNSVPAELNELTTEENAVFKQIVFLLQTIDASWQPAPVELARGRALFLKKLADEEPNHPWVQQNAVATLGDLFRENCDELPSLPAAAAEALARDATPIGKLLDLPTRTEVLGQALKAAAVPTQSIRALVMGMTRVLAAVAPISRPQGSGFVYARTQRLVKRKPEDRKAHTHGDDCP